MINGKWYMTNDLTNDLVSFVASENEVAQTQDIAGHRILPLPILHCIRQSIAHCTRRLPTLIRILRQRAVDDVAQLLRQVRIAAP